MPTATAKTVSKIHPGSLRGILMALYVTQTERQIAKALGTSQTWVSNRIKGKTDRVEKRHLKSVAKGLGLTIEQLTNLPRANTKSL